METGGMYKQITVLDENGAGLRGRFYMSCLFDQLLSSFWQIVTYFM